MILMHEASGMSGYCLELATELADSGFRMFLPLLFGQPGQSKDIDVRGLFCMRKEMHFLASRRTSPITQLLRLLIVEVANRTQREKVGVIGMCLTGNLVFALMGEVCGRRRRLQPAVAAPAATGTVDPRLHEGRIGDRSRRPNRGGQVGDPAPRPSLRW